MTSLSPRRTAARPVAQSRDWRPSLQSELELICDQLAALDRYHAAMKQRAAVMERTLELVESTREHRMDAQRRQQANKREHEAMLARSHQQLRESAHLLASQVPARAVIVHRGEWFRSKLVQGLQEHGVDVVAHVDDGAVGSGLVVAEQPDLLLVQDLLPSLPGLEVVERAAMFAPKALLAAQIEDGTRAEAFLAAGARAVFSRRVPPAEVVSALISCLEDQEPVVLV